MKKDEQIPAEQPTARGLFDMPAPVDARATPAESDEEAEILAEIKQDEEAEEGDEALLAS